MEWLLKLGIGGVQSFIANARSTRDLAVGSGIIASSVRDVISIVQTDPRCTLILPAPSAQGRLDTPHQLVLRVRGDRSDAKAVAATLTSSLRTQWCACLFHGWEVARDRLNYAEVTESAVAGQINSSIETYWAAVCIDDRGYQCAFQDLLRLYEGRRLTRTFDQVALDPAQTHWACQQCGSRPMVTRRRGAAGVSTRERRDPDSGRCVVCAAREALADPATQSEDETDTRLLEVSRIPSTHWLGRFRVVRGHAFASHPLRRRIDEILLEWYEQPPQSNTGADDDDGLAQPRRAEEARANQKGVLRLLSELMEAPVGSDRNARGVLDTLDASAPYYVICAFDGDRMGKWFSEDVLQEATDPDECIHCQQEASRRLRRFGERVSTLLAPPLHWKVYLGGDDGLFLATIDGLFPLLRDIQAAWQEAAVGTTLSLHASIVHAKWPLQPAMQEVQAMLADAKQKANRHCISILARPQSGSPIHMIGPWEDVALMRRLVELGSNWRVDDLDRPPSDASRPRTVSTSLLQGLVDMTSLFDFVDDQRRLWLSPGLREPFAREMHRRFDSARTPESMEQTWKEVAQVLSERACEAIYGEGPDYDRRREVADADRIGGLDAFESRVRLACFLARLLNWGANG